MIKRTVPVAKVAGRSAPVVIDRVEPERTAIPHATKFVNSVDEMVEKLSDTGVAFIRGYISELEGQLKEPGTFTINVKDMATSNRMTVPDCVNVIFEIGEYMVLAPNGSVWRRVLTPVWVANDENGDVSSVVVYAFPVRSS